MNMMLMSYLKMLEVHLIDSNKNSTLKMSDVKEIIKLVKNDQTTKNELSSRLSL